ncbi:MAG: hypothetical protein EHM35_18785, partial [Planctomycetaceae bacterium]
MNIVDSNEQQIQDALTQGCAALAAAIGLLALLGWLFRLPLLTSLGTNLIPMAPSTALLFILLGAAVFARSRLGESLTVRRIAFFVGVLGVLVALVLLSTSAQGIYLEAERLGFPVIATLAQVPVGHMSPLTSLSFLLVSLSFLALRPAPKSKPWRQVAALGAAFLVTAANFVLVLAYFFGLPL